MDLDINIKGRKFHFGLFDKGDSFPLSIVRMSDKSGNVPSSIVTARMSKQGVFIRKTNSFILKFFSKHRVDFDNVSHSKQELLNLLS